MSHKSPTGFAFGILFEIAAVVAIVSFLPRIDLRPASASAAASPTSDAPFDAAPAVEETISPVGWTPIGSTQEAKVQPSYYQRPPAPAPVNSSPAGSFPTQPPPPLIESSARPQYVEDRLDRASQKLVNSVGSAVSQAANDLLRYPPQTTAPSASRPAAANPTTTVRRPTAGATPTQPRPWMRY